jgi:hypothetical protein
MGAPQEKLLEPLAWAAQLKAHLKQFDQKLYRQLKTANELDKYCLEQAKQAQEESELLLRDGMSRFEADLVAKRHYIWLQCVP